MYAAYLHEIISLWTFELLERIEATVKRTGLLGKNNYAIMQGMLTRLKICVNCPPLLDLMELDVYRRRLQQRDRDELALLAEEDLDMDAPKQLHNAIGMEDGINILSAVEAEKHFVTNLAVGAGYNHHGMQVLLEMAASTAASSSGWSSTPHSQAIVCPVCLDEGASVIRPIFLPCLHAICRQCAIDMLKVLNSSYGLMWFTHLSVFAYCHILYDILFRKQMKK
jgi:hypothetical protein